MTEHFGSSLNPEQTLEAKNKQTLAESLAAAGHQVTVLYTGDMSHNTGSQTFKKVVEEMKVKGIQVSRYASPFFLSNTRVT